MLYKDILRDLSKEPVLESRDENDALQRPVDLRYVPPAFRSNG